MKFFLIILVQFVLSCSSTATHCARANAYGWTATIASPAAIGAVLANTPHQSDAVTATLITTAITASVVTGIGVLGYSHEQKMCKIGDRD